MRGDIEGLLTAVHIAAEVHSEQLDKGGQPYLFHVLRVGMGLLPDLNAAQAGILHDVLEDSSVGRRADLEERIGCLCGPVVLDAVRHLTRAPGEPYMNYIHRVAKAGEDAGEVARRVKVEDLLDNLRPERLADAQAAGASVGPLIVRYQGALEYLSRRSVRD